VLAERFGFRSPEQASNALVTAKRQFERTLRAVIAGTERTLTDEEIDAEIAELCATLQRTGPLGLEWDRALIWGPQGSGRENLPALDESRAGELACLLSVRGTQVGNWHPQELHDLLRHSLALLVSEYLSSGGRADQPGKSSRDLPEKAAESITLAALLQTATPALGLLTAVKRHARRLVRPGASDLPAEVHRFVYFASIAAALVRHGRLITKSGPEVLRTAFQGIAAESSAEDWLRELFETAQERLSDRGRN
jgi:hypothetical protein